jgi:hypothetical protein
MISEGPNPAAAAEIEALETTWPRAMIAEGIAGPLTRMWVESRRRAIRQGHPAFARHPMNDSIAEGLFHARRARRLVRGLEGAEASLAAQESGLKKVEAARGREPMRISRLLVVSEDGSPRFFRQVEKVQTRFARRIAVLVLECDEETLGAAAFGPGKRARALLIDHKEAVIRFLKCLDPGLRTDASSTSS